MGRTSNAKPGDPTKIVRGLTTVFGGLHEMFEGITEQVETANGALEAVSDGVETAREIAAKQPPVERVLAREVSEEKPEPEPKVPAKKGTRRTSTKKAKEPPVEELSAEESKSEEPQTTDMPSEFEAVEDEEETAEPQQPEKKAETAITEDDIRKVVVAKLKQKRANNEAVQALLKAYGVESLHEMKPEKYESFLSDISQL